MLVSGDHDGRCKERVHHMEQSPGQAVRQSMLVTDDLSTSTASNLQVKMDSYLGLEEAKLIAELYGIEPGLSPKETFDMIERFASHGAVLNIALLRRTSFSVGL